MSDDTTTPPSPPPPLNTTTVAPQPRGVVGDVVLWRDKRLSLFVVGVSTATWALLQFKGYSFLTLASWVAILTLTPAFVFANLAPLFGNESLELSLEHEVSAEAAVEKAKLVRAKMEEWIQWVIGTLMVRRDWVVFGQLVGGLQLLAWLGTFFDLITLLYIGVLLGLTLPPVYVRYEDKIKGFVEKARQQAKRCSELFVEKGRRFKDLVNHKVLKRKVGAKEKKVE